MSIEIERTGNPVFPWRVAKLCETDAEMIKAVKAIEALPLASAFAPLTAIADGFPPTGANNATHVTEAPELPPVAAALMDRGDEEAPTEGLKAGEANG